MRRPLLELGSHFVVDHMAFMRRRRAPLSKSIDYKVLEVCGSGFGCRVDPPKGLHQVELLPGRLTERLAVFLRSAPQGHEGRHLHLLLDCLQFLRKVFDFAL
jgi:hypothetical protein